MTTINYSNLPNRVKAAAIDGFLIILLMMSFTDVFSSFESVQNYVRLIAFLFVFVFYEPLFVTLFGASIGHMFMDLRVRREDNPEKNIPFHLALIRFTLKFFLGWMSFFTMNSDKKNRAMHDIASKSVVLDVKNSN